MNSVTMAMDTGKGCTVWWFRSGAFEARLVHDHSVPIDLREALPAEPFYLARVNAIDEDGVPKRLGLVDRPITSRDFNAAKNVALSMLAEAAKRARKSNAKRA